MCAVSDIWKPCQYFQEAFCNNVLELNTIDQTRDGENLVVLCLEARGEDAIRRSGNIKGIDPFLALIV